MSLPPIKYRTARCLKVISVGEKYELTHELNGRRFVLPATAYQLLKHLKDPLTIQELINETKSSFPEADIQKLLNELRNGGVIVATGDDETFHRRLPNKTLFGIPTYNKARHDDSQKRHIVLLGVPFGNGNKMDAGCSLFPAKLRWFAQSYLEKLYQHANQLDFRGFGADDGFFAPLKNWLTSNLLTDGGNLVLQKNEYPSSVYNKVERMTAEIAASRDIPIMLGGDHSLTFPAIAGISKQYEALQIIQFDAHTDTYINPIAELYHEVGKAPHHHGNFLSKTLESAQIKKVWQFGIRGPFTMRPAKDSRCEIIYAHEISDFIKNGNIGKIDPNIPTYLTFDIDFFDPTIAPGTATPVLGGPNYKAGLNLLHNILKQINVVGADIMEVNPERDRDEQTMQAAVGTLMWLINGIKQTSKQKTIAAS